MLTAKNKTYWIAQSLGWILFAFISLFASYVENVLTASAILVVLFASATGLLITHGIKFWMLFLSHGKKLKPKSRIWIFVIIIFASCVQVFLQIIWQNIFYEQFNWSNLKTASLLYTLINWLVIFTVWTAMYLLYRFIENERETEIQELKLQALQNEIELSQLKSQLNPHFLFNALNGIRALINENTDVAREAITRLAEMLRQTFLFGKRNTISLEEEMNLVKDYLAIEKLRFEERLEIIYTIDQDCNTAQIPPFIIQTIAENAIKHGISKLTSGGKIGIKIIKDAQVILIEIRNSGKLEAKTQQSTGIGWENCRKRLALLYGNNASFEVREENMEVVCNFKIPFLLN